MTGHRRAHGRSERSRRGKTQQGAALCSGLIGLYDHVVAYRKERVLVTTWERAFGSSLSLKDWMPGTGAAGVNDQVNHHFVRVFGHALLLSVLSAGVQLSQVPSFGQGFTGPS